MELKYVKMNNNERELSLGNFCRVVKEISLNKAFASQQDVFYAIFGVSNVSDSTVNNYCIGYRTIGTIFKQIFIKRRNYPNKEFDETVLNILSILKGRVFGKKSHDEIVSLSNDILFNKLCLELYNLSKNDKSVGEDFSKKIYDLINSGKLYETLCELLLYIVLEKKQPIYVDKSKRELFESILNNTNISIDELEQFVKIQLNDGINYTYSLKKLAKEKNPYASFELGDLEYNGRMTGKPRYVKAYEYFKVAALKNHPRANWLIGKMLIEGKIGKKKKEDMEKAFEYLKIAEKLGSVAAINSIGICYLKGICGKSKSINKAIKYFKRAALDDYVYAHNNLGIIYEEKSDLEKAFEHYYFSASLEESWACNKLGEWYREGIYVEKDMKKSFNYYNKALNVPLNLVNYWAFYNLAKYFYLEGNFEAEVEKNTDKTILYFNKALEGGIEEALKELIYIYIDKYKSELNDEYLNKVNEYLKEYSLKISYIKNEKDIKEKLLEIQKEKLIIIKKV